MGFLHQKLPLLTAELEDPGADPQRGESSVRAWACIDSAYPEAQRLLELSMEDPTPSVDTPEVVGGLKTSLGEKKGIEALTLTWY